MADLTPQERILPEETGRNRMKREPHMTTEREIHAKNALDCAYPEFHKKPAAL
jgi:hypothetical protein